MRGWLCTSFDRLSYQASTGWLRQAQPPMFDELSHLASRTSACLVLKSVYKKGSSVIFISFFCDTVGAVILESQKKPEPKTPVFNLKNFMCYPI